MNIEAVLDHEEDEAPVRKAGKVSGSRPETATPAAVRDVIDCKVNKLYYGSFLAVRDTHIAVKNNEITAFIGPSGCGKSTVLRCLNRMNDFVPSFRLEGSVHYQSQDIYAAPGRPGRGTPLDRHGVPAAQSVRDEHLQERRLWPEAERLQRRLRGSASSKRCAARRCGTRSRTS